jgi:hypothetical protein
MVLKIAIILINAWRIRIDNNIFRGLSYFDFKTYSAWIVLLFVRSVPFSSLLKSTFKRKWFNSVFSFCRLSDKHIALVYRLSLELVYQNL